jgi:hypothetical protein
MRERERQAEAELEKSRRMLAEDRIRAARLAKENHRNQFSDMIRDALEVGYDRGRPHAQERKEGT